MDDSPAAPNHALPLPPLPDVVVEQPSSPFVHGHGQGDTIFGGGGEPMDVDLSASFASANNNIGRGTDTEAAADDRGRRDDPSHVQGEGQGDSNIAMAVSASFDSNTNNNNNNNNAAADNNMSDDGGSDDDDSIVPNFDLDQDAFDEAGGGASATLVQMVRDAGFNPKYVTIIEGTTSRVDIANNFSFQFMPWIIRFELDDGTKAVYRPTTPVYHWIDAIQYAKENSCLLSDETGLDFSGMVPRHAIELANAIGYPPNQFAVLVRAPSGAVHQKMLVRVLNMKTGHVANDHLSMCVEYDLDYNRLTALDTVDEKVRAGEFGLPCYGDEACVLRRKGKVKTIYTVFQMDGTVLGGLKGAYKALRILQDELLREVTKAVLALRGDQSVRSFHRSWTSSIPSFTRATLNNFLSGGNGLLYENAVLLLKHLHSTLTQHEYNARPDVAGGMACLLRRVRPGDHLPDDHDCVLRSTSIGEIAENGGRYYGLVYHQPQRTATEQGAEANGDGEVEYSTVAVKPETILVVNVMALRDIDGDEVAYCNDEMVARYVGVCKIKGRDAIALRVFYNDNDDEVELYLVYAAEEDDDRENLFDVRENLFVVSHPGPLPIFYEESPQLASLITLRDALSGSSDDEPADQPTDNGQQLGI